MNVPNLLIISGPTASGKTALSEKIAMDFPVEVVNADVGQLYKPLCIGTAKPDLAKQKVPHYLFDVLDAPEDLTVFEYRNLVLRSVNDINKRGNLPVIVGGSLFYLKSLFFPQKELLTNNTPIQISENKNLWEVLYKIDPDRAKQLHPNDIYRINRALQVWHQTGVKPSLYKPEFNPGFNSIFVFISPEKKCLDDRINQRTREMILQDGWIEEVKSLVDTNWEPFLKNKGLIGYTEIFDWIKNGEKQSQVSSLIDNISLKTRQYAKKQLTFWKSFQEHLKQNSTSSPFTCKILQMDSSDQKAFLHIKKELQRAFLLSTIHTN